MKQRGKARWSKGAVEETDLKAMEEKSTISLPDVLLRDSVFIGL